MSIQRYDILHPKMRDKGRFVFYADHIADKAADLHNLLSTLADIRAALGVDDGPMLVELAGIVRTRESDHSSEVERLTADVKKHKERRQHFEDLLNDSIRKETEWLRKALDAEAERDALSKKLMLTKERLDKVLEALDEERNFSSGCVGFLVPASEVDDISSLEDIFPFLNRFDEAYNSAVRERDDAVEALKKLARLGSEPELGNSDGNRIAQAALAKIEGGRG